MTRDQVITKILLGETNVASLEAWKFGITSQEIAFLRPEPHMVVGMGSVPLPPDLAEKIFGPPPESIDT